MTEQMQAFLEEFAILLEKHEVEIEASESDDGPLSHCDGIDFTQATKFDGDEVTRERCEVKLPCWIEAKDVRKSLGEE